MVLKTDNKRLPISLSFNALQFPAVGNARFLPWELRFLPEGTRVSYRRNCRFLPWERRFPAAGTTVPFEETAVPL